MGFKCEVFFTLWMKKPWFIERVNELLREWENEGMGLVIWVCCVYYDTKVRKSERRKTKKKEWNWKKWNSHIHEDLLSFFCGLIKRKNERIAEWCMPFVQVVYQRSISIYNISCWGWFSWIKRIVLFFFRFLDWNFSTLFSLLFGKQTKIRLMKKMVIFLVQQTRLEWQKVKRVCTNIRWIEITMEWVASEMWKSRIVVVV